MIISNALNQICLNTAVWNQRKQQSMNEVWLALTIARITRDLLQPWRPLLGVAQTLVRDPFFDPVAADLAQSQHKKTPLFFPEKMARTDWANL